MKKQFELNWLENDDGCMTASIFSLVSKMTSIVCDWSVSERNDLLIRGLI
jgi:hypothetical protein